MLNHLIIKEKQENKINLLKTFVFKAIVKKIRLYWYYKFLFLLILPGLVAMLIFQYFPMYGLLICFQDFMIKKGISGSEWVGFKNFIDVFNTPGTIRAIKNSFILGIYGFIVGFPITIIFTLLINEVRNAIYKRLFQTISYLPYFLSWVVVAALLTDILSPSRGIFNYIIKAIGGDPIYFLIEPKLFRTIVVFSSIWKGIGWSSIIYLAAIAGVNSELYDAAIIDGAGRLKKAIHVTLPAMYPIITITLIFSFSGILGGDFEQIFNLVNSQTLEKGEVISVYVFNMGLRQFEYSKSAVIGLLNNLIAIILLYACNKIASKFSEYTIW